MRLYHVLGLVSFPDQFEGFMGVVSGLGLHKSNMIKKCDLMISCTPAQLHIYNDISLISQFFFHY